MGETIKCRYCGLLQDEPEGLKLCQMWCIAGESWG